MKNMMKYISLALLFFFLGSNVQKIEAKDLFKCNYEFNFSELYGNAKNETTKFTITVTSDKNATVDGTLKNAQGPDIFGGNTFNWINSFSSQFNTEAKKNNTCPSLRFSYRDSTFTGMLSISNDTMAEVSKVVDGKISDAKVETSKEKVINNDNNNKDNNDEDYINGCGDLPKTTALLKQIYGLIKYLIPVLVIGLSIVDFLKVLLSGEEKVYKDAWSKFVKRIIIGIVILLLPILLKMVINISGVLDDYNVDGNNIFCILS